MPLNINPDEFPLEEDNEELEAEEETDDGQTDETEQPAEDEEAPSEETTTQDETPAPEEGQQDGQPAPKYGKFGDDADKMFQSYQELEKLALGKLGGMTVEQFQELQDKAAKFDQIATGLPSPDGSQPGGKPSAGQVKSLIEAAGLNFETVDWDNLDAKGFGSLLRDSIEKMGSYLLSSVPTAIQQTQQEEQAIHEEIQEGVKLDPRLDSDQLFRERVADKIEIAAARGVELTVAQAVAQVQDEYRSINKSNVQNSQSEETHIKKGTTDIVPKSGGGSKPVGDRPKTPRDAVLGAMEETGFTGETDDEL